MKNLNRLMEFRAAKRMDIDVLASLSGIDFITLLELENGMKKMNANQATSLSAVLSIPPEILLGDDNYEINPKHQNIEWIGVRKEFIQKSNRLKEIRINRKIKETEFAKLVGVARSQINHWETGKRPIQEKYFDILCEVLNVSEEMLLGIDRSQIPEVEPREDQLTPDDIATNGTAKEVVAKPIRERKQTLTNKKGYVFVYDPLNEMAGQDGYVPLHRLVMSLHVGRPLTQEEVVHHIDENPSNNKLSNLMLFKSNAEHLKHHRDIRDKAAQKCALELANELLKQ